ncbi:MAG: peptide-methionine (S)-S-oxide reductase MsrA [Anaerolineaceae bacterium]
MADQNINEQGNALIQTATLGGGCFWCLEPVFEELNGVIDVEVGYAGGRVPNPNYEQVCSGMTGHAEVARITFDAGQISYGDLLGVFFSIHDPTTLNRQGADIGKQYRSIILYHTPEQEEAARRVIQLITQEKLWPNPVVTEVVPLDTYYKAEDYHQEYFRKNPYQGYCSVVIAPKVAKFRKKFAAQLKKV